MAYESGQKGRDFDYPWFGTKNEKAEYPLYVKKTFSMLENGYFLT
jgi:hypothetical protein